MSIWLLFSITHVYKYTVERRWMSCQFLSHFGWVEMVLRFSLQGIVVALGSDAEGMGRMGGMGVGV